MCASFMTMMLIPIQGELPELLGAAREDTAWVITVTLLVSAITNPIAGKLGDMYGKRRIALVLLLLLVAGSVVSALATSVWPLVVGRALQGSGMGVIPLGISILRDTLHKDRLGSAIALVSATLGVGGALGLPISAYVAEHFDWRVLFWFAAGLGVVCFALYVWIVPPSTLRTAGRFDFVGAVGLSLGLVGVLLAVSRGSDWGWLSPTTLICFGGGVVVLLAWGWYELRRDNPLVDLRVSARGPVLMTNLASIAMGFALFSSNIVFPQLLELPTEHGGMGLSLLAASLVLMPAGLGMLVMAPVVGRVERRVGPKPLLVAGAVVIALTYGAATLLDLGVWSVLIVNTSIGIGIGLGYAAMPALVMRAVPSTETAASNGLNTLMRGLGTSFAAAVVAAVLAGSATDVGGRSVPSMEGFHVALVLGLVAAVLCAVLALFIPRPRDVEGEHPSLPEGSI
ncbi:MFS transporter permease [Microbacterium sp. No. 7]|nr:MFS transporter [Microbacterium sp. No. 7]ALJ21938.1 MFS transporter permease [Microbacterium sp. No. 7]